MADEKVFTIPLRDAFLAPRTSRAKKASTIVRQFLERHMKSEDVKIGESLNKQIWSRGIQKPPRRVKVHVVKNEEGTVFAELVGKDIKTPSKEELKKKKEKMAEKEKKVKEARKERKQTTMEKEIQDEKQSAERTREEIKEAKI